MKTLNIPRLLWWRLLLNLRRRGGGYRESGAFLLGKAGSSKITTFILYDDLDPEALDTGIIVFHGCGFVPLWQYCRRHGMQVIADVHTHPGDWTSQSESDRTHPMISQAGHVGLIVPCLARDIWAGLRGVGIHEYLGNHQWKTWDVASRRVKLSVL